MLAAVSALVFCWKSSCTLFFQHFGLVQKKCNNSVNLGSECMTLFSAFAVFLEFFQTGPVFLQRFWLSSKQNNRKAASSLTWCKSKRWKQCSPPLSGGDCYQPERKELTFMSRRGSGTTVYQVRGVHLVELPTLLITCVSLTAVHTQQNIALYWVANTI